MKKPLKKRKAKPAPMYRVADLQRLEGIVKRLNYRNALVQQQAKEDMRKLLADKGDDIAGLMLAHLQSGDPMTDGPCIGAAAKKALVHE